MEGVIRSNGRSSGGDRKELFHIIHKVPAGDSPYVRAKHFQLVEKDNDSAIIWLWKAINGGDRTDSALKDMAVIMKQRGRAEEAIEAIKSFRHLCSKQAQESLDNLLIDLYKKCGMFEDQVELLKQKLRLIYQGEAFNGKTTKTARSHGRKFQVSVKQETARVLVLLLTPLSSPHISPYIFSKMKLEIILQTISDYLTLGSVWPSFFCQPSTASTFSITHIADQQRSFPNVN